MPSLDDDFQQLVRRLAEPGSLVASGSDPFYYFVYAVDQALTVKRSLPVWSAQIREAGLEARRVSFSSLLWELVDASGRWDEWLAAESEADPEQVNSAIGDVLAGGQALSERVAEIVGAERPGTVVLFTETEMLHPYFRVRVFENALHDRIKIPTVVFYPGRRVGQFGLRFLDLYPDDPNYRATLIGGLP